MPSDIPNLDPSALQSFASYYSQHSADFSSMYNSYMSQLPPSMQASISSEIAQASQSLAQASQSAAQAAGHNAAASDACPSGAVALALSAVVAAAVAMF